MEQEYTPDQIDALEYEALMNNEPVDDAEYDAMMSAIYDNFIAQSEVATDTFNH